MGSSLDHNPPTADRNITAGGTDWLWTVFALMLVSTLGMIVWTFTRPRGTRFFHNIALIILATASLAYFSMASDLGATPIRAEFAHGHPGTRQIWYVRYIQWFITFPLLLVLVLFPSGLSLSDILTTCFFAWFVVVSGLVGALVASSYKWGYFTMGVVALFYIWAILLGTGPRSTFNAGSNVRTGYVRGAGYICFITMLYPITWGCSEGGNVISPTREMVWYGILDLFLGPIFVYYYLFSLHSVDFNSFGFQSGKYADGPGTGTGGIGNKSAGGPAMSSTGAGTGPTGASTGVGPGTGAGTGATTGAGTGPTMPVPQTGNV